MARPKPEDLDVSLVDEMKSKIKTKEDLRKVKVAIFDPNIELCFISSPKLRGIISQGVHPLVKKLPDRIKALLLEGRPFAIQKKMVYDFITGKIDKDNEFILKRGDIRIVHANVSLMKGEV